MGSIVGDGRRGKPSLNTSLAGCGLLESKSDNVTGIEVEEEDMG